MTDTEIVSTRHLDPNHFTLNGGTLSVRLTLGGVDAESHLRYRDSHHVMDFVGDQITVEATSFGRVATVTTMNTAGIGQTSFSLIIPEADVSEGPQTVTTVGLTTMHRKGPGAYTRGQLRTFHITELRGNAKHVDS